VLFARREIAGLCAAHVGPTASRHVAGVAAMQPTAVFIE
jgi:hypothetical protein